MGFGTKKDDKKNKKSVDNADSKFNMNNTKSVGKAKTKTTNGAATRTRGASRGS